MALRGGDVVPAVHAYADHGRVTITGTIDQARQQIVEDWWAVHHNHTTAILAVRRADVSALNDMVRARREAGGELGEEIRIGDKAFSVGDRVIFEKNQRVAEAGQSNRTGRPSSVRIRNGTFGTVVGVVDPVGNVVTREGDVPRAQGDVAGTEEKESRTREACALVVELEDARRAVLPHSYVETSTSLGYALTVFRSQGITVDHTFGLGGDSLFQEAGYTQLSRGRLSNNLYVAAPENPRWEIGHQAEDAVQRDALQSLVDALSQSREQTMAQDRLPTWPATSPDELAATYHQPRHAGPMALRPSAGSMSPTSSPPPPTGHEHARVAGRDTARRTHRAVGARGSSNAAVTHGSPTTATRSPPGPTSTAPSAAPSTAWARSPPTPDPNTSRHCLALFPNASPKSNAGRPRPEPLRHTEAAGTSPARRLSVPNRPIPNNAPTGSRLLPQSVQPDS